MAYELWAQDNFTKGELSPYMYARASVNAYYNGLKTAQNVLTYATGAAGKRFGTLYQATIFGNPAFDAIYFASFQYLNQCVYQLVFVTSNLYIFLEGILIATVSTSLSDYQAFNLHTTILGSTFRITEATILPQDLTRSGLMSPPTITSITGNVIALSSSVLTANAVLPVQLSNSGGTLPSTTPQINAGVVYFIWGTSATHGTLYLDATDAKFQNNPIIFNNSGTGTNSVNVLNTWTLANTSFTNLPYYDFNGAITSYDGNTFTASATTGSGVTITVSPAYTPLTSAYVGGAFFSGSGSSRITAVASTSSFTVDVLTPFANTSATAGIFCLLAEPAWSTTRGWPAVCGSYQNRALFANTSSLPNGFWASVINEYSNFGNLTTDDDDAISWFPSSNTVNVINFIVPYRSITVHTNTGIYSSPLFDTTAITPANFSLQLQESTPADVLQPQAIDNQIFILTGNDLHTQLWDGINNAYTSDVVSIINEQVIRDPIDEAIFSDFNTAGSRYIFIINENGSMGVYQTLLAQEVAGMTPQIMEQSYGNAYFRQAISSADGRAWFLVERQMATAGSSISISGYTAGPPSTLTATSSNFSTTQPTAITFTTTGTLPSSSPAINTTSYFWAIGATVNTFYVYTNQSDAIDGTNPIVFSSAGTNSHVVPWPALSFFTIEELTTDTYLDCAVYFNKNGSPSSSISTGSLFNAQDVTMIGDGYAFTGNGFNDSVTFSAHGKPISVNEGYIGFPIITIMEPMPLSISLTGSPKNTTLTKPKHTRTVRFMFNNTIGGSINGVPIALQQFSQVPFGSPPEPANGIFELGTFNSWDDFNYPTFTIYHDDPFNIELLGIFYSEEI